MRSVHTWLRARQPARVIISVDVNYISETRDTGFTVSWNIVTMDRRDIIRGREEDARGTSAPKLSTPVFGRSNIHSQWIRAETLSTSFDSLGAFIDPSGSNRNLSNLSSSLSSNLRYIKEKRRWDLTKFLIILMFLFPFSLEVCSNAWIYLMENK